MFVVFFAVFYAIVTYGFLFTAQQSLNLAAQDGARQLLRWTSATNIPVSRGQAAISVANDRASWVAAMSGTVMRVGVCYRQGNANVVAVGQATCSTTALAQDQLELVVQYAYGAHPLTPQLPLIGALMIPKNTVLESRAVTSLGIGMPATVAKGI